MMSRYPAPIVKMSYWLVKVWFVTGSVAMLDAGKLLPAVFIRRAFTRSGVRLGCACNKSAAAPLTIGAAMLVPLKRA